MKNILIALLAVVLLLLACIYIFIPNPLQISETAIFNCTKNGLYRFLADESKWQLWWPDNNFEYADGTRNENNLFSYGANKYLVTQKLLNGVEIGIQQNNSQYKSQIMLLPKGSDSVIINWACDINASPNPFKRFLQYKEAVSIRKNMKAIVKSLQLFAEKKGNIYTIDIIKSSITDTLLIATKYITSSYPSTEEVYGFLNPLKEYIIKLKASQTGNPMLNVTKLNDKEFQTMVAIPINKELPASGNIFPRKMIPGNFMTAEIKGGQYTIDEALQQMQNFFDDYHKTSMAIPFQSLVTDRVKEPDTAKWITKIYSPVMR